MAPDAPPSPTLADLAELSAALERERDRPRPTLHRRDREIGRDLVPLRDEPARQLAGWVRRVREPGDRLAGRVTSAERLLKVAMLGLGLLVGWGVATAVFWYDGTHPVNVVNVLAVFVGLQLLLLVPLIVAGLRRDLAWFSPARLVGAVAHLLPGRLRAAIGPMVGSAEAHQQVYARVQKWALLHEAQRFAIGFNVAVLLRYLQLVFFSDLAFAWSTTLQVDAATVHRITSALAAPWAWALQAAVPSADLVEQTKYFRLRDEVAAPPEASLVEPATFGGWWSFLLMCLLVYGLAPRVIAWAIAGWRLRRAVAWTMVHTPGAGAVLDRLNSVYVETRATEPEDEPRGGGAATAEEPDAHAALPARVRAVINWSQTPLDDAAARAVAHADTAPVVHCGGSRSLEEDRDSIERVAQAPSEGGVVMVTKSWEPPMLEVVDFLGELRKALGPGVPIAVTPIALGAEGGLVPPDPTHLVQWEKKLRASGDAWLSVAAAESEGGETK